MSTFKLLDRVIGGLDNRAIEVLAVEDIEKNLIENEKTVLYVGARYDYGNRDWGLSYEHYTFFHTLVNMGYSLVYFDYDRLKQRYGTKKASKMLLEVVYYYCPDILFYFHYLDWIEHDVWKELSYELPTKTIIWLADDHWRYEETKSVWELFNIVVTTDKSGYEKRVKEKYKNVLLSQWGCNHFLYKKLSLLKKYDISFVGRCYGERNAFIDTLKRNGIEVATFGQGWEKGRRVSQVDLIKIYNQSKISLNISLASKSAKYQVKGRDFEAPGCGSSLLTKDTEEIKEYFVPGTEIITYHDVNDAAEKIKYYLKNERLREEISEKGYERVLKEHTIEKRVLEVFKFAQDMV